MLIFVLGSRLHDMTKAKKTKKFALHKRTLSPKDMRLKSAQEKEIEKKKKQEALAVRHVQQTPTALFFKYVPQVLFVFFIILIFLDVPFFEPFLYASFYRYNTELGPPFRILVDTNFINWSIKNKIDMIQGMMDCLLAKCIPYVTDCVIAELEKFGTKYRVALRLAKDPRIERLPCSHKGTYADDCIVERVRVVFITLVCAKSLESLLYRCYL